MMCVCPNNDGVQMVLLNRKSSWFSCSSQSCWSSVASTGWRGINQK